MSRLNISDFPTNYRNADNVAAAEYLVKKGADTIVNDYGTYEIHLEDILRKPSIWNAIRPFCSYIKMSRLPRECRYMDGSEMVDFMLDIGFTHIYVDRLPSREVVPMSKIADIWLSLRKLV